MIPMKSPLVFALVLSSSIFSGGASSAQPTPVPRPSGPVEVNGIAAKVNGRIVTRNQVNMLLAPAFRQLSAEFPRRGPVFEEKFKLAKSEIIQELVDRQIILDEFKQLGAFIKPHLIDEEIKRQIRELYAGDETKFRAELKANRMTMEGYREITREKMVVQAMRAQQFSDAPPPLPGEIQKEYDKIKLSLRDVSKDVITFQKIFIPAHDPENPLVAPEEHLSMAEDLAKQLAAGKDFSELAKLHSKDAFAEAGGLQEDVPRLDLSPEFASILFESPVGKVIGPLLDPQGFTIIKPVKLGYGPVPPLDNELRAMIEKRVSAEKTSEQYKHWISGKRKRAMVDIRY
jgi:peptidyl-prolyl cis-trans isomerase SurA